MKSEIQIAAALLGRRGGKARAERLSEQERRDIAASGGNAANKLRSKSYRRSLAKRAAQARWEGVLAARRINENARRIAMIDDLRNAIDDGGRR